MRRRRQATCATAVPKWMNFTQVNGHIHRNHVGLSRHLINKRLLAFAPLLAALVFGGWAAFVNSEFGLIVSIRSGMAQAVYALFSTWIVSKTVVSTFSFARLGISRMLWSFVVSFLVMMSIPLSIHYALATPRITSAILPGAIWGSGYIATYLWVLSADVRRTAE